MAKKAILHVNVGASSRIALQRKKKQKKGKKERNHLQEEKQTEETGVSPKAQSAHLLQTLPPNPKINTEEFTTRKKLRKDT